MLLRLSRFVHLLPLGESRVLVVDAISHVRLTVDGEVASLLRDFATPREVPPPQPDSLIAGLIQRGILTDKTPEEELAHVAGLLRPYHGRDPEEMLERFRREKREGVSAYFAAGAALAAEDLAGGKQPVTLLLYGDCDVQMESDFLRREAAARGFALTVAASFADDMRLASEHAHDAVVIGALEARYTIPFSGEAEPHAEFIAAAKKLLDGLREHTSKPILIDNLPEPTVEPLGLAERGARGHRNRFRSANLALAELVENYSDVHVVDIAASLSAAGSERLLDDGLVAFAHFGSPGWLLQRSESEKAGVHNLFPDIAPLADALSGDPYLREKVTARAHLDAVIAALGVGRKKCVILDLDGLLWPGVLAETGKPFNWSLQVSGPYSYVGLYFGLHEALLKLKQRGILLACVSKNDEATVRELWRYESQYAPYPLLTPDDLVTVRINWHDKVENIRSIADELDLALDTFLFLDDNPVERDRVRQRLPQVEVWGEDPFALRRKLLTDPRLQVPSVTAESAARTELAKAQLGRQAARKKSVSEAEFLASLAIEISVEMLKPDDMNRVVELFQRTSQFNTTGAKFSAAELEALARDANAHIFTARVKDRFGDHGLVGAAVVKKGEIAGLVLSCRVLGMGVEHEFMRRILAALARDHRQLSARIIETARNIPVRNIYRDHGFVLEEGAWRRTLKQPVPT
jgi:FkbH-like protein